MKEKTDVATRRSKRQKGEDASGESLKQHRKRKKLAVVEENDPAGETANESAPTLEQPNFEEEALDKEQLQEEVHEEEVHEEEQPTDEETKVETAPNADTEDGSQRIESSQAAGQTEQSQTTTKRRRGRTRMSRVAKNHEDKIEVEFISHGEHVGDGSVTLSSFVGLLVRETVPVLLDDWRRLDEQLKETMWEQIQARFNLTEKFQKDSVFKQMGNIWRSAKSRTVRLVRAIGSKEQLINLKPNNINSVTAWMNWVKMKKGKEFKVISEKYRKLRRNQIPHTTSHKGMVRLAHEMKKKSSDPSQVTRSKVWIAGHPHSDGRPVRPEFKETIEKIKSIDSEMESTASMNIKEDAVSQVLGKDKPGRVRGMGRGITATKLAFMTARDSHVQKLEAQQAELQKEVLGLKDVVRGLASSKSSRHDDVSNTENSDLWQGGPRCQILDWCSREDVVIGEGEFISAEPTYKIGRVPLGPNAAAVLVKAVMDEEASVWRPTPTVTTLVEAKGVKIAWQFDKLILDELDSSAYNKAADSSGTNIEDDKIHIYAWNKEDEVIAEGRLGSTNPKELVNNIPLGQNAAVVKVERVLNKDGSLWRPDEERLVIGDIVLGESIAWPLHKIQISTIQANMGEWRSKSLSPGTFSNTSNTGHIEKKKCILLDWKGSGKKVAVGRVFSTNPEDVVHFVPLGANASKVFVDVPTIEDAPLWRGNTELKIIKDALDSIIAWPNDKLVYI